MLAWVILMNSSHSKTNVISRLAVPFQNRGKGEYMSFLLIEYPDCTASFVFIELPSLFHNRVCFDLRVVVCMQ